MSIAATSLSNGMQVNSTRSVPITVGNNSMALGKEEEVQCIVGITKTPSALSRWALSHNLRSQIADETHTMFGLRHEDKFSQNELSPARKHRDNMDESSLCAIFEEYKVFSPTAHSDCLYNIATKDLVTKEIQCSLLDARILGQQQMSEYVEQRLQNVPNSQQTQEAAGQKVEFYDPIHKNNAPIFIKLCRLQRKRGNLQY